MSEDRSAAEARSDQTTMSEDRSEAEARSDQTMLSGVAERLATVRDCITAAGGAPDDVTVVAVTKGHGPAAALAAVEAGLTDIGENYAADLAATAAALGGQSVACHFLGRVQRNKVRAIADVVHLWQGVDRAAAGREIATRCPAAAVLVQINLSGEAAKNGCHPDEVAPLVDELLGLGLRVRGLMGVAPAGRPEDARPGFRSLVATADRLGLPERSIGMTDDFEVAVAEGATMIRLGRRLFGPRNGADDLRR